METDKKEEVINGAPQVENGNSQDNLSIKEEKEIAGGRSGICNIGNTCYMSTGLQVLKTLFYCLFHSVSPIFPILQNYFSQMTTIQWWNCCF